MYELKKKNPGPIGVLLFYAKEISHKLGFFNSGYESHKYLRMFY